MNQLTTPTTLPAAQRNALVVAANIKCHAQGCHNKATRWSNLCGLCERKYLEDLRPVFGKPTKEQLAEAQATVREHFAKQISEGVFDDWASQIGRTFARPVSILPAPLAMRRYKTPRERFAPMLALRTRDRGSLARTSIINLISFALAIDALITPTIPAAIRSEYMIALLGQRFMSREVYSRTVIRYRSRREATGVVRYGPNGPQELTRMVEEEIPLKEYHRIRRADMRYIGRRVWQAFERMLIAGGRQGAEWRALQDRLRNEQFVKTEGEDCWKC